MWNDLRENLKNIKEKIKGVDKKAAREEYIRLAAEKAQIQAEINRKKSEYYAELAKLGRKQERKKSDHLKFLLGGMVISKFGEITKEEFEKILEGLTERKHEHV